jgi:hypothetical protein
VLEFLLRGLSGPFHLTRYCSHPRILLLSRISTISHSSSPSTTTGRCNGRGVAPGSKPRTGTRNVSVADRRAARMRDESAIDKRATRTRDKGRGTNKWTNRQARNKGQDVARKDDNDQAGEQVRRARSYEETRTEVMALRRRRQLDGNSCYC